MKTEHHTQKLDFGKNGYFVATRDDTDEIQDFYLKAFLPDNTIVRQIRILYNIKYDYWRKQIWYLGDLIIDVLESAYGYGQLIYYQDQCLNSYPDNFEPVKPEGCDVFRLQGYTISVSLIENKIDATINLYIYNDLLECVKPDMSNLITHPYIIDEISVELSRGCELVDRKLQSLNTRMSLLYEIVGCIEGIIITILDISFLSSEYKFAERNFRTMKLPMRVLQNMLCCIQEIIRRILIYFQGVILFKLVKRIVDNVPLTSFDTKFYTKNAKKKRIEFIRTYSKRIHVKIPYDSRFIE